LLCISISTRIAANRSSLYDQRTYPYLHHTVTCKRHPSACSARPSSPSLYLQDFPFYDIRRFRHDGTHSCTTVVSRGSPKKTKGNPQKFKLIPTDITRCTHFAHHRTAIQQAGDAQSGAIGEGNHTNEHKHQRRWATPAKLFKPARLGLTSSIG